MNKVVLKVLLPVVCTLALSGCKSGYKQFYQPAQGATPEIIVARREAPPPATPIVERASPGESKTVLDAYGRCGYVMIGHSTFNSGRPDESAIQVGREVRPMSKLGKNGCR